MSELAAPELIIDCSQTLNGRAAGGVPHHLSAHDLAGPLQGMMGSLLRPLGQYDVTVQDGGVLVDVAVE